ncbi:MAG TPA: hypothetical protein DCP90_09225 [Clostridiales bacterium]|nr:MAG: hypothetical protein A2Y22_04615 [Clostridiales bacterium GWD2_32_59]HAN10774.1 hypothetical protein [Clostridiales bacterium]
MRNPENIKEIKNISNVRSDHFGEVIVHIERFAGRVANSFANKVFFVETTGLPLTSKVTSNCKPVSNFTLPTITEKEMESGLYTVPYKDVSQELKDELIINDDFFNGI